MNNIPFIIAEIGINHNGDINLAKKLIDASIEAGVNAIKFQKRNIELAYSKEILDSQRDSPWGKTQRDQKEGLEFNYDEYLEIDQYCKHNKIEWLASAWDLDSLNFVAKFDNNLHKIASAMIIDKKFVESVAKLGKHTFISTGMSSLNDIECAVEIFQKHKTSFELMHCISTYPMKTEDANLNTIPAMKKHFNCNVGYSGHESGIVISLAAAALGISSLERHITLDRTMYGSDQAASIEPNGFKKMVSSVRKISLAMGTNKIGNVLDAEKPIAEKLRAHLIL